MSYSVDCECGKPTPVSSAQAGSAIVCTCGRTIQVPRLSQLREAAGQGAFEAGTIDTINRMIRNGELPWGQCCAVCGMPTTDAVDVQIVCERRWFRGAGSGTAAFVILSLLLLPCTPIWLMLGWSLMDDRRRELGRDTVVSVPLRVCPQHRQGLAACSGRTMKQMLRTVPIYEQLLNEYPWARV